MVADRRSLVGDGGGDSASLGGWRSAVGGGRSAVEDWERETERDEGGDDEWVCLRSLTLIYQTVYYYYYKYYKHSVIGLVYYKYYKRFDLLLYIYKYIIIYIRGIKVISLRGNSGMGPGTGTGAGIGPGRGSNTDHRPRHVTDRGLIFRYRHLPVGNIFRGKTA